MGHARRAVVIALREFRRGLEDCSLWSAIVLPTGLVSWLCVPLHTLSMALLVHLGRATALLDCCLLCPSLLQSAPPAASKGSMHHKRKISILIASNSCVSFWMQQTTSNYRIPATGSYWSPAAAELQLVWIRIDHLPLVSGLLLADHCSRVLVLVLRPAPIPPVFEAWN